MKPQKATTWELGTDIRPNFFHDLSVGLTYYHINFTNQIAFPAFFLTSFYSLYPNSYIMNVNNSLTSAQVASYIAPAANAALFSSFVNNPATVYALENGLNQNLSATRTSGLDFNINWNHKTNFGSVFAGVSGNYILTYDTKATPESTYQGIDANSTVRLHTSAMLGVTVGEFLARASWDRTGGFAIPSTASDAFQAHVKPFNVFNLAFQYSLTRSGFLDKTSFNLNIDNVFNTDPPVENASNGYSANGFTLGRLITVGIKKKF